MLASWLSKTLIRVKKKRLLERASIADVCAHLHYEPELLYVISFWVHKIELMHNALDTPQLYRSSNHDPSTNSNDRIATGQEHNLDYCQERNGTETTSMRRSLFLVYDKLNFQAE